MKEIKGESAIFFCTPEAGRIRGKREIERTSENQTHRMWMAGQVKESL